MEFYYSFSVLIIIATLFTYINLRFLKFPSTIGVMIIAIVISLFLVLTRRINPEPLNDVYFLVKNIDFSKLLMGGMLYFLLFAGAIQIDINELREQKLSIMTFSTISVIISTFLVGFGLYYTLSFLLPLVGIHLEIPLIYCLLFGALISPTDAVAVLGILKQAHVPKPLEMKVTGEALFNDGVAVILFTLIYNIAQGTEQVMDITAGFITLLLIKEIFGAFLVGLILGYIAFYAMKSANDAKFTVLVTLSVVVGGYMISQIMGISGPLTMVASGIVIGHIGRKYTAKKKLDTGFLKTFWELTDEILNAVLFLLMGFELLLINELDDYWIAGAMCILIVLIARYLSIKVPTMIIPFREKFTPATFIILVWGGLRGGVSIALALSIGNTVYRDPIVAITYFVVVFSIVVQGLSVGKIAGKLTPS